VDAEAVWGFAETAEAMEGEKVWRATSYKQVKVRCPGFREGDSD